MDGEMGVRDINTQLEEERETPANAFLLRK